MRKLAFYILLLGIIINSSCGNKTEKSTTTADTAATSTNAPGDSTLYGLACEGCTDSVLVFLPFSGGDPVTYDIIEASQKKRIIGRPETGDWVGVTLNAEDKEKADMVINLDRLKGKWVYKAMPELNEEFKRAMAEDDGDKHKRDSLIKTMMVPREQGFALKRNYAAEPVGMVPRNNGKEHSPVVYPEMKLYSDWAIFNGKLILSNKSMMAAGGKTNMKITAVSDTAEFVFMMRDSLQLKFKDGVRNYYRIH